MREPLYNKERLSEGFHGAWESRGEERYYGFEDKTFRDEVLSIAEYQAKAIVDGATDLISDISSSRSQSLYQDTLNILLEKAHSTPKQSQIALTVQELLDDYLGIRAIEAQAIAEKRLIHLIALVQKSKVSWCTKKYLHRATECYLYGFDEQFVIMCRSALESAFIQAIQDSLCRRFYAKHEKERPKYFSLGNRLYIAKIEKLYSENILKLADEIREAANSIVHPNYKREKDQFPITEESLKDILMKTIVCISEVDQ